MKRKTRFFPIHILSSPDSKLLSLISKVLLFSELTRVWMKKPSETPPLIVPAHGSLNKDYSLSHPQHLGQGFLGHGGGQGQGELQLSFPKRCPEPRMQFVKRRREENKHLLRTYYVAEPQSTVDTLQSVSQDALRKEKENGLEWINGLLPVST